MAIKDLLGALLHKKDSDDESSHAVNSELPFELLLDSDDNLETEQQVTEKKKPVLVKNKEWSFWEANGSLILTLILIMCLIVCVVFLSRKSSEEYQARQVLENNRIKEIEESRIREKKFESMKREAEFKKLSDGIDSIDIHIKSLKTMSPSPQKKSHKGK